MALDLPLGISELAPGLRWVQATAPESSTGATRDSATA
jgi:hypothetical protein